ncbi:hypothetical protein DFAR_2590014 [Desulfarculales bacterium]
MEISQISGGRPYRVSTLAGPNDLR